jgi:hypothetical protein
VEKVIDAQRRGEKYQCVATQARNEKLMIAKKTPKLPSTKHIAHKPSRRKRIAGIVRHPRPIDRISITSNSTNGSQILIKF